MDVGGGTAPMELGQEEHPCQERTKQQAERQARRDILREARKPLMELPADEWFEIPGRPHVVWELKDYSKPSPDKGRADARTDAPFLFKAFETGQKPPPRPGTKKADQPRAATIHEYLDWTVTASEPDHPDDLDFGGFRVVLLSPRFRLHWPPPDNPYCRELPSKCPQLGAPKPALPQLLVHQKPICAATIRLGPGFLEVPFYATAEVRRNKGYGRSLMEALEGLCRTLCVPRILLCSTDDVRTKATWQALGFSFTQPEELQGWGVSHYDLLHMDNTVQMHKEVPPAPVWRSVVLRHQHFRQRLYYTPGSGDSGAQYLQRYNSLHANGTAANRLPAKRPSKQPAKKKPRKR